MKPMSVTSFGAHCRRTLRFVSLLIVAFSTSPALAQDSVPKPFIFVGESLTAGVQNGALLDLQEAKANGLGNLGQQNGYAAQLAAQARAPLVLPRILWPGFPNVITLLDFGPPFVVQRVTDPPFTLGRVNPQEQATNLGVPGDTAKDALTDQPDSTCAPEDVQIDPTTLSNTNCVLGAPGLLPDDPASKIARSQVEWAEALTAGTIFVLLGTNESLGAIFEANPAFLVPVGEFKSNYAQVLERLEAVSTTLVVATVPDPLHAPFLTSTEEASAVFDLSSAQLEQLGLDPGDFVTPSAFEQIQLILTGVTSGPLSADVVLTADEAETIRETVDEYNVVIAQEAATQGAVLVDLHGLVDEIADNGVIVTGQRLTLEFGGGLVSLDGVHLTNTGYAIVANLFIDTLRTEVDAGIPRISIAHVRLQDPLVDPFVGRPPTALEAITSDMVQSLRLLLFN